MGRKKNKEAVEHSSRERLSRELPEYKFGTRLKTQMKRKGIKQAQLAKMMKISESCVKDWCQHYTFPNDKNLGELCRIFAPCSSDYFHGNIEEPNYDVKFVTEYTGLSLESLQYLKGLNSQELTVLDKLFSNGSGFTELLHAFKQADIAQQEVDALERANDGIERHINDTLSKAPPEYSPGSALYEVWTREANETLQRLDSMLTANINGIEFETAAKDLVIRKFYAVLEKFVEDVAVEKWTWNYKNQISERVREYCISLFATPSEADEHE